MTWKFLRVKFNLRFLKFHANKKMYYESPYALLICVWALFLIKKVKMGNEYMREKKRKTKKNED